MLFCSLLPVALLVGYVLFRDRKHPEPAMRIVQALTYGLISALLSVPLSMTLEGLLYSSDYGMIASLPFFRGVFTAFVGAAIPEESMKLLMLWLLLRKCAEDGVFDEAFDGIVYAVCVGMGFAGFENVLYVFYGGEQWQATAIVRSLLAVPGHYIFAVLMGFFYSLVHFYPIQYRKYRSLVLMAPILTHGIYDSILMVGAEHELLSIISYIPLVIFCLWMHRFCQQRLNYAERLDEEARDVATFCEAIDQMQSRTTPPPFSEEKR